MSDLVKRLRVWAEYGFPNGTENAALDEAADRIEALEAEVNRLKGLCGRAAEMLDSGDDCGDPKCDDCAGNRLAAELKEASHE